jgi:hypothetical protein
MNISNISSKRSNFHLKKIRWISSWKRYKQTLLSRNNDFTMVFREKLFHQFDWRLFIEQEKFFTNIIDFSTRKTTGWTSWTRHWSLSSRQSCCFILFLSLSIENKEIVCWCCSFYLTYYEEKKTNVKKCCLYSLLKFNLSFVFFFSKFSLNNRRNDWILNCSLASTLRNERESTKNASIFIRKIHHPYWSLIRRMIG